MRSLRFDDRPDYDYLKRLFRELFFRKGFCYDNMFDWEMLALRSQRSRSVDEVQGGDLKVSDEGSQGGGGRGRVDGDGDGDDDIDNVDDDGKSKPQAAMIPSMGTENTRGMSGGGGNGRW